MPNVVAGIPAVGDIELSQDESPVRKVTVSYSLSEAAIVTVDFQTNVLADASGEWISIGARNFTTVTGDVNRIVQATEGNSRRMITWDSRTEWPNVRIGKPRFRAAVTAWPTNSPPDYMVIDLRPSDTYPVRYYVSEDALPYGPVTNRIYKDELLVLKRIHAKGIVWLRGASEQVKNWFYDTSIGKNWETQYPKYRQHPVMLTRDYYIGVYEITEGQYWRVRRDKDTEPSTPRFPRLADYSSDGNWVPGFRGDGGKNWPTFNSSGEFDYVQSHAVRANSFFGQLRARVEVKGYYDMPTDAQWEYAARAGTDEPVPVRLDMTSRADIYSDMCRYVGNKDTADCEGVTGKTMATVGSYEPNPWGLYDMLGNCYEFVLDHYGDDRFASYDPNKVLVDPYGSTNTDSDVSLRGGHATQSSGDCNTVTCSKCGGFPANHQIWGTRVAMDIH